MGRRLLQLDDARVRGRSPQARRGAAPARPAESRPCDGLRPHRVGPDADERLAKEESFYRDLHKGYRDHFDRLGQPEGTVGVAAENAGEAQAELARHRALDTAVVRALASATIEDMSAVAEAAAPGA